jgi:hypothetical protein
MGGVAGEGREEGGEGRWLAGKAAGKSVGRASDRETRGVVVDMDGAPCKGYAVVKVEGMDDVSAPVVHVCRPFVDLVKGHPLFHFLHDLVLAQNCRHLKPNANSHRSNTKKDFLKKACGVMSPPIVRTCTSNYLSILYRTCTSKCLNILYV